jgi:hypothetical protein
MQIRMLSLALLSLLIFTGCQKDDPPPPTKTELISRNWKVTAMTAVFPAPIGTVDVLGQIDACEKDNIIKIQSAGTYTVDEGATKCDPTDPQIAETGNLPIMKRNLQLLTKPGTLSRCRRPHLYLSKTQPLVVGCRLEPST